MLIRNIFMLSIKFLFSIFIFYNFLYCGEKIDIFLVFKLLGEFCLYI